jgi:hypothetical protein
MEPDDFTLLLQRWSEGDGEALQELGHDAGISKSTLCSELRFRKVWLHRHLARQ